MASGISQQPAMKAGKKAKKKKEPRKESLLRKKRPALKGALAGGGGLTGCGKGGCWRLEKSLGGEAQRTCRGVVSTPKGCMKCPADTTAAVRRPAPVPHT